MEARVTQDNHTPVTLLDQPLKRLGRDMGGGTRPPNYQAVLTVGKHSRKIPDRDLKGAITRRWREIGIAHKLQR
jgi:hypothetical protein